MILILLKYALNAKQIHKVIHVGLLSHLLLVKELKMEKKNYINIDYLLNILRIINGKNKEVGFDEEFYCKCGLYSLFSGFKLQKGGQGVYGLYTEYSIDKLKKESEEKIKNKVESLDKIIHEKENKIKTLQNLIKEKD